MYCIPEQEYAENLLKNLVNRVNWTHPKNEQEEELRLEWNNIIHGLFIYRFFHAVVGMSSWLGDYFQCI